MNRPDPIEAIVEDALCSAGFTYTRRGRLDFQCDGFSIECKQFYTERALRQLAGRTDVVLIQGRAAAEGFARLLSHKAMEGEA